MMAQEEKVKGYLSGGEHKSVYEILGLALILGPVL